MSEREYEWRETYFVWFDPARRPTLSAVEQMIDKLHGHYEIAHPMSNDEGQVESLTIVSPDDHAALEITYLVGDDIREEGARLATEIAPCEEGDRKKLARLHKYNARFDVMHFEEVEADGEGDEDEMLDPGALLIVLDALVELTHGVGVDPQSGTLV